MARPLSQLLTSKIPRGLRARTRGRGEAPGHPFASGALALLAAAAGAVLFRSLVSADSVLAPALFAFSVGGSVLFAGLFLRTRRLARALRDHGERLADQIWELREDGEQTRLFLDSQGDLIVRRDGDGRIVFANDAYCDLVGRPLSAILDGGGAPEILEQSPAEILSDGTRLHDQRIAALPAPRWIAWREAPVRIGNGIGMQAVGRDITKRIEAEQALAAGRDNAEAASRAKSRFLAMASHEIRTPLGGILGMAGLLAETPLTPEQTTYLTAIRQSGKLLHELTEDVLDLARAEAGRLTLESGPFRLRPLLEEIVELLAPRAQAKGLAIAADLDDSVDIEVTGDAARLRQVLINLLGNAIKFTETGGATLVAEAGDGPDEIMIEVRDTGAGIAADAQARIFGEFEQADFGGARSPDGAGLGLAISQRIVDLMGGRIALDSRPGEGATFRLSIPLPRSATAQAPVSPGPDLTGQEILIVSPFATDARLLARRLGRWGAKTCQAADAQIAAALLPERAWSALLVDEAIAASERAVLTARAGRDTRRLLLVTPAGRRDVLTEDANGPDGFGGYLVKPVRIASLAGQLAGPLSGSHSAAIAAAPPSANAGGDTDDDAGDDLEMGLAAALAENLAATLPVPAAAGNTDGLAILVAEDNDINALLARALLARLGHTATLATNGAAAVAAWIEARASGAPFDVILMDIHMPGLDGLEATRRIRTAEASAASGSVPAAGSRPVAILALTANDLEEDRAASRAAGMDGFLVKPLDRDRLHAVLAPILQQRARARNHLAA